MNIEFYNSRIAVVLPDIKITTPIPDCLDLYEGPSIKGVAAIKAFELSNDTFYSAVLFIKDIKIFNRLIFRDYKFSELIKVEDHRKKCYFKSVHHTGVDSECKVDEEVVVCSSWVAPFYAYNTRPGDNMYGGMFRHRIIMDILRGNLEIDNHITII